MFYFFVTLFLSALLTLLVKKIAFKLGIIDSPDRQRKLHPQPTPLLGGVAIFLSFWLVAGYFLYIRPIYGLELLAAKMTGVFLAGLILIIMGAMEDKKPISPRWRLFITAVAAAVAVVGGLGLEKITNPWGGIIPLGLTLGNALVFVWLMGMMFTTKILDGLDGLSAGVAGIGGIVIFLLAVSQKFYQPNVALLAAIFAAACLGFLLFNFYPAKIFLGEGGGLFIGFMLGALAVISGGKIATALLVMAIPILDLARVAYVRFRKKQSIFQGDREHLHFRLLDAGFSQRQAVVFLYGLAFLFGITTLFLSSLYKLYALGGLLILMVVMNYLIDKKLSYARPKTF